MAANAQRGYYGMAPVVNALEARLDALSETIPKGSVVLDIGCNDGTISNTLLERGVISKSYGFDLEDILAYRRPEIEFQAANIRTHDLNTLPDADGVLMLNVLHHVIGSSVERAKEIVNYMLDRYSFVVIDLGSFTENGDWGWRRVYDKNWQSDSQMWDALFSKAEWRFKLLRYPTQGKGERTLWKLYKRPYAIDDLEIVETYKRPPEAWPLNKKLIPLENVGDTKVVQSVDFSLARSGRGDRFWLKKYRGPSRVVRAELEMQLAILGVQEIRNVNAQLHCDLRAARPVAVQPDGRLAFLFEPDLFGGTIVHFQDWTEFFTIQQCRAASVLATRRIEVIPELPRLMLLNACDFQICSTWDGLTALDFEPNNWLLKVRMNNGLADGVRAPAPKSGNPEVLDTLTKVESALDRLRGELSEVRQVVTKSNR